MASIIASLFRTSTIGRSISFTTLYTPEPGFAIQVIGALSQPHHPLHFQFLHKYRDWDASCLHWTMRASPKKVGLKPRVVRSYCMRRIRVAMLLSLAERGYGSDGRAVTSPEQAQEQLTQVTEMAKQKKEVRQRESNGVNIQLPTFNQRDRTIFAKQQRPIRDLYGFMEFIVQPPAVTADFNQLKSETDSLVDDLIRRISRAPLPPKEKRVTGLEILRTKRILKTPIDAWSWNARGRR